MYARNLDMVSFALDVEDVPLEDTEVGTDKDEVDAVEGGDGVDVDVGGDVVFPAPVNSFVVI